jgi:tetratricopeptide (TPR) repeat protein
LYTFLLTILFDVLVFYLYFLFAANFSTWLVIASLLPIGVVGYFVSRSSRRAITPKLLLRAVERCQQAFESGDVSTGRRAAEEILAVFRRFPRQPALASITEASFLSFEERYDDALVVLGRIDDGQLDIRLKSYVVNNRAWCEAQLGRTDKAIELARSALEVAESSKSRIVASCRGTLGTALFLADRSDEALPLLLEAFEGHSRAPRLLATNAYYLGAAYKAMNQLPQARSWYECAAREAPKTRFGALAVAALRDLKVDDPPPPQERGRP